MNRHEIRLTALAEAAEHLRVRNIRKQDMRKGDCVMIKTCNSVYTICVLEDGLYRVSGGWFDAMFHSPTLVTIQGCTWGGSAVKPDIIAEDGLCIEFGNHVRTSAIQNILMIPVHILN